MSGYIEIGFREDGITLSYFIGAGSYEIGKPVSVWLIPGTAK